MKNNLITPVSVPDDGASFLIDRIASDCTPLQFIRELTQNAIEAVEAVEAVETVRGGTSTIRWDYNSNWYKDGFYKLCIQDTGLGMNGEEIIKYYNNLAVSSKKQSNEENFGLGAKVAACAFNPAGVEIMSWPKGGAGIGYFARFCKSDSGHYGLLRQENDGEYSEYVEVDDKYCPEIIKKAGHGTQITLLGKNLEDNTLLPPPDNIQLDTWIGKYLNKKYFTIPAGIQISTREGLQNLQSTDKTGFFRTVYGQKYCLDEISSAFGVINCSDAKIHWWIIDVNDENKKRARNNYSKSYETTGHLGILWKNELYQLFLKHQGAAQKLQQFGITFGQNEVVIYVEPVGSAYYPNTCRSEIVSSNDAQLPWNKWQKEFQDKFPKELKEYIEQFANKLDPTTNSEEIQKKILKILHLYGAKGSGSTTNKKLGIKNDGTNSNSQKSSSEDNKRKTEHKKDPIKNFSNKNNGKQNIDPKKFFPDIKWISQSNGTRAPGDLEDRAARFDRSNNILFINEDYYNLNVLIDDFAKEHLNKPGSKQACSKIIKKHWQTILMEVVIGASSYKGSEHWDTHAFDRAVSEEALTSAVMPKLLINQIISREIGIVLGAVK